jgi:predicted PurR-regulated permease PerM
MDDMLQREGAWRDEDAHERRARHWAQRRDTGIALVCWLVLLGVALWALSHVFRALLLLVIGALLAYALAPAVGYLRRFMPRWLAILIVYLALLAALGTLGTLIVQTAVAQITALVAQVQLLIKPGEHGAPSQMVQLLQRFGLSQAQLTSLEQQLGGYVTSIGGQIVPVLTEIANATLDTFLILVVSIYLLVDGGRVATWLRTRTPLRYRPRIVSTLNTFQHVVGGYIRGQLTLSALIGVLVGIVTFAIPATRPYAVLLALVAFFFEFIPIIGTLVSGVLCVALALQGGIISAIIMLGCFIGIHIIEGDVVGPRIVGEAVGLHPVVSIIALIAGAELFGIWGALFASPVAGVAQALMTDFWREWNKAHASEFAAEQPGDGGAGDAGGGGAAKAAATTVAEGMASSGVYRATDRRQSNEAPTA